MLVPGVVVGGVFVECLIEDLEPHNPLLKEQVPEGYFAAAARATDLIATDHGVAGRLVSTMCHRNNNSWVLVIGETD